MCYRGQPVAGGDPTAGRSPLAIRDTTNTPMEKLRKISLLGLAVLLVASAISAATESHGVKTTWTTQSPALATTTHSAPKTAAKPAATRVAKVSKPKSIRSRYAEFIKRNADGLNRVSGEARTIFVEIQLQKDNTTKADLVHLAGDAHTADDDLNALRQNLDGRVDRGNTAPMDVFSAANDLENAMGQVVTWAGDPTNAAVTAQIAQKLRAAGAEWNRAMHELYGLAHNESKQPLL